MGEEKTIPMQATNSIAINNITTTAGIVDIKTTNIKIRSNRTTEIFHDGSTSRDILK